MGKIVILWCLLASYSFVFGQEEQFTSSGLVRTTMTIAPSKSFARNSSYFYIHGQLETYLTPTISAAGEGYFFLGKSSGEAEYSINHGFFWGFSKHVVMKRLDLFVGVQPGMLFTKVAFPTDYANIWDSRKLAINPSVSGVLGINYYFSKYAHFFIHTRFLYAQHTTDYVRNISDMRFSAGLGFQVKAKKD